jgi:hypothetical protein
MSDEDGHNCGIAQRIRTPHAARCGGAGGMPPREADGAEREVLCLASLPHALVLFIFSLVPVDQRLRCLEVCKGWYATLHERSLWTRLDMSATAGLARPATEALLRAAAARACGQIQALHLTDCVAITHEVLLAVARANAGTLTELRMEGSGGRYAGVLTFIREVEEVLGAAPRLRLLAADVYCTFAVAHRLLRNEGVFAALRMRKLQLSVATADGEAGVVALAADLAAHACLANVHLHGAPLDTLAALDAVVDAALTLRLPSLMLVDCHVTPASAPALARLLSGGALTELYVLNDTRQLLDQPAAALIADALRANSTLTSLKLVSCSFWRDAAAAALILGALTAHRSLRTLDLSINYILPGDQQSPALGAALGALVAANAAALHELHLSYVTYFDAGLLALGPLVDALPFNTHLRTLNLDRTRWTDDFARDRLLPAVRANTSLRRLTLRHAHGHHEFLAQAAAVVAARNAA